MEPTLPIRRHPAIVSEANSIAHSALDYTPPKELDVGLIAGHPWGVRTLVSGASRTQYMVYDKRGRNVLSCCRTPELAAKWASDRLARDAIPPEQYSPRLAGMSFGARSDAGGALVMHTVVDAQGQVVAQSSDGRAVVAAEAVKALVSRPDCTDATREEFAQTVVFARVSAGRGRTSLPMVYDNATDEGGMDFVGRELRMLWKNEPLLQQDGYGNEILQGNADLGSFVTAAHASLLRYAANLGGHVAQLNVRSEGRMFRLVYHSVPLRRESALDHMYAEYLDEVAEKQVARLAGERAAG